MHLICIVYVVSLKLTIPNYAYHKHKMPWNTYCDTASDHLIFSDDSPPTRRLARAMVWAVLFASFSHLIFSAVALSNSALKWPSCSSRLWNMGVNQELTLFYTYKHQRHTGMVNASSLNQKFFSGRWYYDGLLPWWNSCSSDKEGKSRRPCDLMVQQENNIVQYKPIINFNIKSKACFGWCLRGGMSNTALVALVYLEAMGKLEELAFM